MERAVPVKPQAAEQQVSVFHIDRMQALRLVLPTDRLQMDDLTEEKIQGIISRTMDRFDDFVSVRNLNNAQLKQLIEKIEVDKDRTVDVYLRLFEEGDWFPSVSAKTRPLDAIHSYPLLMDGQL